jgi:hypothetical protein
VPAFPNTRRRFLSSSPHSPCHDPFFPLVKPTKCPSRRASAIFAGSRTALVRISTPTLEPETKMPTYFNGDASVLPTILEGKADKQIDALWNYLLQGQAIESPGN